MFEVRNIQNHQIPKHIVRQEITIQLPNAQLRILGEKNRTKIIRNLKKIPTATIRINQQEARRMGGMHHLLSLIKIASQWNVTLWIALDH